MSGLLQVVISLALVWVFAYRRAHMYTILASLLVAMLLMSYFDSIPWLPSIVLIIVGFFYLANDMRRQKLTLPLYSFFQRVLPPINRTESEALEAGDVWWEVELFQGDPDWKELLNYPRPQLTAAEQAFIDNETETLCGMLNDWQIVQHDKDLSTAAWQYLKEAGFLGMIIPKQYGGL